MDEKNRPVATSSSVQISGTSNARIVGSAIAGISELALFHPVDTIAKRLMSTESRFIVSSASETILNLNHAIFRNSADASIITKMGSLFPGIGFGAAYKVLQRVYKFGGQPVVKDALKVRYGPFFQDKFGSVTGNTLLSATAGSIIGVGEIFLLPLDALKVKAQTAPEQLKGRGVFEIFAKEGFSLYRGAGWTAARNAPGSFALFGGNSLAKSLMDVGEDGRATWTQDAIASSAGAIASITVAQPLDVIKTRIQNRPFNSPESGFSIMSKLVKNEGFGGFFKGIHSKFKFSKSKKQMSANLEALVEVASGAAPIAQLDEAATAKAAAEAVEAVAASGVDEEMKMPAIHDPSVFHSSITDPSVTDAVNELAKNLPMSQSAAAERRRKGWVKKTWDERLEELKEYKMVHGDANVPTLSKENPSLGHWVHDQRKQYRLYNEKKQTAMTPHRIEQLEAVGFKWALQRHTTMRSWQERFEELKQYMAKHGNCNVPIRYKENASLGQWVSTQRQEYGAKQKGQKSNITDERIKTLEEIGFTWSLRDTSKMAPRKSWDAHFQSLVEFKEKNGHCDVRVRSKQHPTGSLGRWVEKQRHHYNSRAEDASAEPKITDEQIAKLEGLGFKWRVRNEKRSVVEKRERLRAEQDALKQEEGEGAAQVVEGQHLSIPDIGHEETAAAVAAEVAAAVAVEPDVAAAVAAAGELPEIRDVSDIHEGSLDVAV